MSIREGKWDCKTCGQKGNRGPNTYCGACGSPRPDNVEFYLPDNAEEITDQALIRITSYNVCYTKLLRILIRFIGCRSIFIQRAIQNPATTNENNGKRIPMTNSNILRSIFQCGL